MLVFQSIHNNLLPIRFSRVISSHSYVGLITIVLCCRCNKLFHKNLSYVNKVVLQQEHLVSTKY